MTRQMFVCSNFQIVTFDYGMRDRNPMDELRFYAKNAPDVPFILRKDEASNYEVKIFYDLLIQHFFWVGWEGKVFQCMAYSHGFDVVCAKLGHKLEFSLPFFLAL